MTYTQHRDTQETLAVIESLDLDSDPPTQEEIAKKFGWEDDFYSGSLSAWQEIKPKVWALFDEPWSSKYARVCFFRHAGCRAFAFAHATLFVDNFVLLSVFRAN